MALGDLTTLDSLKAYLRLDPGSTDDDPAVQRCIASASAWFSNQIQRDLTQKLRTETIEWNSMIDWPMADRPRVRRFPLTYRPVISIADDAVTIDGRLFPKQGNSSPDYTPDPTQPAETQSGWVLRGDVLEVVGWWALGFSTDYLGSAWWPGLRFVDVTYTAGYVSYDSNGNPSGVPGDVEQAVIEIAGEMLQRRSRLGLRSRSVGGESVVYMVDAIPPAVQATIAQYASLRGFA